MICSVLIPTRRRWRKLEILISDLHHCCNRSNIEIIIRSDIDDRTFPNNLSGIDYCILGPRYRGYADVQKFYTEASELASGDWIWMLNDDARIEGNEIDRLIGEVTDSNVMIEPEFQQYRGNPHIYVDHSPFPIIPNGCWREYGQIEIPIDCKLYQLLLESGWVIKKLEGVTFNHDRGDDKSVNEEHAI